MRVLFLISVLGIPCGALALPLGEWAERKIHCVEKGLAAMKVVARGNEVHQALASLLERKQLKIASTRSEAAKAAGAELRHGGGFYVDTIFVDEEVPFVAFVATLVHEGTHAIEFLMEEGGKEKLAKVTPGIVLHSEHRAYRAQDAFLEELIALDGRMKEVIQESVDYRYLLDFPVSENTFRMIFQYPVPTLDAYLRQNPYDSLR